VLGNEATFDTIDVYEMAALERKHMQRTVYWAPNIYVSQQTKHRKQITSWSQKHV